MNDIEFTMTEEIVDLMLEFQCSTVKVYKKACLCKECKQVSSMSNEFIIASPDELQELGYFLLRMGSFVFHVSLDVSVTGYCHACKSIEYYGVLDARLEKCFKKTYDYVVEDLGIYGTEVEFYNAPFSSTQGYMVNGVVRINTHHLNKGTTDDFFVLVDVLSHELRHVWQHQFNKDILSNYISSSFDYDGYWNHPSEVDARDYADKVYNAFCELGRQARLKKEASSV